MKPLNIVVLVGTVAAEPVERRLPDGSQVTEYRVSVPEEGMRLLPLPVVATGRPSAAKGDGVTVTGKLHRRFYRSGAGARSLTEVRAESVEVNEPAVVEDVPSRASSS